MKLGFTVIFNVEKNLTVMPNQTMSTRLNALLIDFVIITEASIVASTFLVGNIDANQIVLAKVRYGGVRTRREKSMPNGQANMSVCQDRQ